MKKPLTFINYMYIN